MNFKITKTLITINIIALLIFIIITIFMLLNKTNSFDSYVYSLISPYISYFLTKLAIIISFIGDTYGIITICLILLIIPKTRWYIALPASITVAISALINFTIKNIFCRPRPNTLRLVVQTGYSFPSGHSMNNMALYTMIVLCLSLNLKNKRLKYITFILLYLFVLSIGISRIYLGVHYASDVLAGFAIGIWTSTSCYFIFRSFLNIKNI